MNASQVKILIVENEKNPDSKVSGYLKDIGYDVSAIFSDSEATLNYLQYYTPDFALVDIQFKGKKGGINLARTLKNNYGIALILLTDNFDYATFDKAKEVNPLAILSKPLNVNDLRFAIELAIIYTNTNKKIEKKERLQSQFTGLLDRIFVHHGDKRVKILIDDILYIQAERNYCKIVTASKEYTLSMPMKSLEDELPFGQFQRIHRSHIVNLKQVEEMYEQSVVIAGKPLILSKTYQQQFLQRIKSV